MNGFLVMLRCTMDDIPLFLTDSEAAARQYASLVEKDDGHRATFLMNTGFTNPISIDVLEFKAGQLASVHTITEWE